MSKENRKIVQGELMMLLAGVCLCLVLISSHLTSGLYARYTTSASGSDSARVIQFNQLTVTENGSFTDAKCHLSWQVAKGRTFLKSDQDLHIYYKELKPNETLSEVRFIDGGAIQVGASGTMEIYESYPPTKFSVRGYAVQANGFETVAAAWNSVKE
jgi:hypothetical protein